MDRATPRTGNHGSVQIGCSLVWLPVFWKVLDWTLKHYPIPPGPQHGNNVLSFYQDIKGAYINHFHLFACPHHRLICLPVTTVNQSGLLLHLLITVLTMTMIPPALMTRPQPQPQHVKYCHDHANSIPIWTNSTLLLVYSNIPTPTLTFLLPTPMFLLLLRCLAFPSCSCHSFRYIPLFLLSPTCQSVTLHPTYPFHVFPPFHVILLLRFLTLSHGLTSGNWGRDDISWYTL